MCAAKFSACSTHYGHIRMYEERKDRVLSSVFPDHIISSRFMSMTQPVPWLTTFAIPTI